MCEKFYEILPNILRKDIDCLLLTTSAHNPFPEQTQANQALTPTRLWLHFPDSAAGTPDPAPGSCSHSIAQGTAPFGVHSLCGGPARVPVHNLG